MAPPDTLLAADTPPGAAAPGLPADALACLRRLMRHEGQEIDLQRLCADRAYAQQCLAAAHTSGDERLRRVALRLFDALERTAPAGLLH